MILLVSELGYLPIYYETEADALQSAKRCRMYQKPGDKICLIDFENMRSTIYELGEDLISTCY